MACCAPSTWAPSCSTHSAASCCGTAGWSGTAASNTPLRRGRTCSRCIRRCAAAASNRPCSRRCTTISRRCCRSRSTRRPSPCTPPAPRPGSPARACLIQITDVSIAVARDKLLREQAMVLRSQTFSDGLTGIANRRHFDVTIEKEWRRAKRNGTALTLLMIDIDCFKAYNDHYGHQQGDQCLIEVAAALAGMLKRPCDMMARYGGEEFAMILPETDGEQARRVAEAIRLRTLELALPHAHSGISGGLVSVSIGIATQAADVPVSIAELIGAADRALYCAKRGGRNRIAAEALD